MFPCFFVYSVIFCWNFDNWKIRYLSQSLWFGLVHGRLSLITQLEIQETSKAFSGNVLSRASVCNCLIEEICQFLFICFLLVSALLQPRWMSTKPHYWSPISCLFKVLQTLVHVDLCSQRLPTWHLILVRDQIQVRQKPVSSDSCPISQNIGCMFYSYLSLPREKQGVGDFLPPCLPCWEEGL